METFTIILIYSYEEYNKQKCNYFNKKITISHKKETAEKSAVSKVLFTLYRLFRLCLYNDIRQLRVKVRG